MKTRAGCPIIIDVFPRSQKTGYFGDITRTVVRGRATEEVRRMHDTVLKGQEIALSMLRPGASGREMHQTVLDYFAEQGYETGRKAGRHHGFFHGLGHGVGLELHEAPHLTVNADEQLYPGHVVTIEPGLYYPGIGGVRLEDVAVVTARGSKVLTKFEKTLEI